MFWTQVITSHEIFLAVVIEAVKQKMDVRTNVFVWVIKMLWFSPMSGFLKICHIDFNTDRHSVLAIKNVGCTSSFSSLPAASIANYSYLLLPLQMQQTICIQVSVVIFWTWYYLEVLSQEYWLALYSCCTDSHFP